MTGHGDKPNASQPPRRESTADLIDRILAEPLRMTLNGKRITATKFDGMVRQLMAKCSQRDVRAAKALLELKKLAGGGADRPVSIEFTDEGGDDDDED